MWREPLADPTLLALSALVLLGAGAERARRRRSGVAIPLDEARDHPRTPRARLGSAPLFLRLAAFSALLAALVGRPAPFLQGMSPVSRDMVVLLDVSDSMLAQDVRPSRFDAARSAIDALVARRPRDRIGLVLFAGEAFTQCPLTLDHERLRTLLDDVRPGELGPGTAIAAAVRLGLRRLAVGGARSRHLLLFTDGAENGGRERMVDAALEAARVGVRIDAIAFGSPGPTPFTLAGVTVLAQAPGDESALRAVTAIGGGRFYRGEDELQRQLPFREMDEAQASTFQAARYSDVREASKRWVLAAMMLVFLEVALSATVLRVLP